MINLNGKNILVTGGSRGIGAGIAQAIAAAGARVGLTYSSRKEAAEGVLASLPGEGHFCLPLNLVDEESIKNSINQSLEIFEYQLDGLVNNAGITRDQLMLRMTTEDFDAVIQANLRGTFLCTKSVLKPMMKRRAGSIVNITSVIGQTGNPGQANYAASKAGVEAFAKSVAKEMGSRGVRVNCVAPGFIVTDMTENLGDSQLQEIQQRIPLKRMGTVQDVAQATVFLLSDGASYITGQTISVNGGLHM